MAAKESELALTVSAALGSLALLLKRTLLVLSFLSAIALFVLPRGLFSKLWAEVVASRNRTPAIFTIYNNYIAMLAPFDLHPRILPKISKSACHRNDQEYTTDTLTINVDFPTKAAMGGSVIIRATLVLLKATRTITNPYPVCANDQKTVSLNFAELVAEKHKVENALTGFTLEMAGADVRPRGSSPLIDGTAMWSVSPARPGRLTGFIKLNQSGFADRSFFLKKPATLTMQVYNNPFAVTSVLFGLLKSLTGVLLAVPGIIAFWKDVMERREKARVKNKQGPRIIIG